MKQTILLVLFGFNLFVLCFIVAGLFEWQPIKQVAPLPVAKTTSTVVKTQARIQPKKIEKIKTTLQIIPTEQVKTTLSIRPTVEE